MNVSLMFVFSGNFQFETGLFVDFRLHVNEHVEAKKLGGNLNLESYISCSRL